MSLKHNSREHIKLKSFTKKDDTKRSKPGSALKRKKKKEVDAIGHNSSFL